MVISRGITTSAPYTKNKGVSPVARLEDVQLAPCFFKQSYVRALRPLRISSLALLTCPLLSG
jgi:hypothetical protein